MVLALSSLKTQQLVKRFDVAKLLESSLDMSYWKGDDCTKGVFFTDEYGYSLNKVVAIRVNHHEAAPEVFYSFNESEEEEGGTVITTYPYKDLALLPRKHHLLFNEERIEKNNLDKVFERKEILKSISIKPNEVAETIEKQFPNKRQRDRTQLVMSVKDDELLLEATKKKKVTFSEIVKYDTITSQDIIELQQPTYDLSHWKTDKKSNEIKGAINAHTLCYLLHVFRSFNSVIFHFEEDRIFMVSNPTDTKTEVAPTIEVVVSLMKS
jgi:hypothetical protein